MRTRIEPIGHEFFVDIWVNGGWKNDTVWPTNDEALRRVEELRFGTKDSMYTADQLARRLLPDGGTFALNHVAAALENMTEWRLERGHPTKLTLADVIKEVRQMNMAMESKDALVQSLEATPLTPFCCNWMLPNFDNQVAGFRLV